MFGAVEGNTTSSRQVRTPSLSIVRGQRCPAARRPGQGKRGHDSSSPGKRQVFVVAVDGGDIPGAAETGDKAT